MKKLVSLLLTGTLALGLLAGCGSNGGGAAATPTPATGGDPAQAVTLKIGASPAPHEEIFQVGRALPWRLWSSPTTSSPTRPWSPGISTPTISSTSPT